MTGALYAYAVLPSPRELPPGLEGVAPGALEVVTGREVAAVAGPVDPAEFEEPALERNLTVPGWLEGVVRSHERVIEALMGPDPVLPMRFGSIFSRPEGLRTMLDANAAALAALLERVRGRVELGVAARVCAEREPAAAVASAPASSGRDYLRRRRDELRARESSGDARAQLARGLHAFLSEAAEDSALLSPRRSDPTLVLNAAYLVPATAVDRFGAHVDAARSGPFGACALELTGPWPPYSFVSLDVSGPRS